MSYDIYLRDPITNETLGLDEPHQMRGGTYPIGGESRTHFNITYNYAPILRRVLGPAGVRTIYGMTGAESLPLLEAAIDQLATEPTEEDVANLEERKAAILKADGSPVLMSLREDVLAMRIDDYWTPTEPNVRTALQALLVLAQTCPDGVWGGD